MWKRRRGGQAYSAFIGGSSNLWRDGSRWPAAWPLFSSSSTFSILLHETSPASSWILLAQRAQLCSAVPSSVAQALRQSHRQLGKGTASSECHSTAGEPPTPRITAPQREPTQKHAVSHTRRSQRKGGPRRQVFKLGCSKGTGGEGGERLRSWGIGGERKWWNRPSGWGLERTGTDERKSLWGRRRRVLLLLRKRQWRKQSQWIQRSNCRTWWGSRIPYKT